MTAPFCPGFTSTVAPSIVPSVLRAATGGAAVAALSAELPRVGGQAEVERRAMAIAKKGRRRSARARIGAPKRKRVANKVRDAGGGWPASQQKRPAHFGAGLFRIA